MDRSAFRLDIVEGNHLPGTPSDHAPLLAVLSVLVEILM